MGEPWHVSGRHRIKGDLVCPWRGGDVWPAWAIVAALVAATGASRTDKMWDVIAADGSAAPAPARAAPGDLGPSPAGHHTAVTPPRLHWTQETARSRPATLLDAPPGPTFANGHASPWADNP
jgi:hypothetical protein